MRRLREYRSKTAQTYSSPALQFFTRKITQRRSANCGANSKAGHPERSEGPHIRSTKHASELASSISLSESLHFVQDDDLPNERLLRLYVDQSQPGGSLYRRHKAR